MIFNWKEEYSRYHRYFINIQKKTFTPQARNFAWLSLSLFTICFFTIVAIKPTLVTIAKLNREIKDKRTANQKLQAKIEAIVAAQQIFSENTENLSLLSEALPEKSEFPRLVWFFEQTASTVGVDLKSLNFEKIGTGNSLYFSLGVTGEYPKLKEFLKTIELSRRLINLQKTSFSQIKKEEESPQLSLLVSGTAFFVR